MRTDDFQETVDNQISSDTRELLDGLESYAIPKYMHHSIVRYVMEGRQAGDFLSAIFRNDFRESCIRADAENRKALRDYAMMLYNLVPGKCWGPQQSKAWIESGGKRGVYLLQRESYLKAGGSTEREDG